MHDMYFTCQDVGKKCIFRTHILGISYFFLFVQAKKKKENLRLELTGTKINSPHLFLFKDRLKDLFFMQTDNLDEKW